MRKITIIALTLFPITAYAQDNEATLNRLATIEAAEMIAEACPNVFVNLARSEAEEDAVFSDARERLNLSEEAMIDSFSDESLTSELSRRAAAMVTGLFGKGTDLAKVCLTAQHNAGTSGPYAYLTTEAYDAQEARDAE